MEWKLCHRVDRQWWRRERRRMTGLWWGHIASHGGPGWKDRVSDVYQQSIHGGSPAPLTITPQHLANPTQETWGHFLPLREFRHTPAASHVPSQPIEEGTDYQGENTERYSTTNSSELTKKICSQSHLLISLFWSHMQHRCDVFLIS